MPADNDALQALIDEVAEDLGVVGAQLAVSLDGQPHEFATGVANSERGTRVTTDTMFQIGSTTKVYTAALVMQLADQGLIDIDRPVVEYLPEFRLDDVDATRAVTPRYLMAMMSGIDNGAYAETGRNDDAVQKYVASLADVPIIHRPGAAYGYSNASTVVSGRLVEVVTGKRYDYALRDLLLVPTGFQHSSSLPEDLVYHRIALGHTRREAGSTGVIRPFYSFRGLSPAGSTFCSTAGDMVRFGDIFLRRGLAADGTRVLSDAAVEAMQTPQVDVPAKRFADSWCVGPYLKVWDGVHVFGHSGSTASASSTLLWIPSCNLSIATVVNVQERGYRFADIVIREAVGALAGVVKPGTPEPVRGLEVDTTAYTGRYESHDVTYDVTSVDGILTVARVPKGNSALGAAITVTTALAPLGGDRFLPENESFTGNHMWDVAFATDGGGRAELFYNGAFASRRVADAA